MIDIILAIVAYFIIHKLIKSLGRNNDDKIIEGEYKVVETTNSSVDDNNFLNEQEAESRKNIEKNMSSENLEKIHLLESKFSFNVVHFIKGAGKACTMITTAIASNDLSVLKLLLKKPILEVITKKNQELKDNNIKHECTFIGIDMMIITDVRIEQNNIYIELKVTSEQINVIFDANNNIISGNPKKIVTINERWTFYKNMKESSNIWHVTDIYSL